VKRIGQDMMAEPEFAAELIVPLKLQGIAEVTDSALVIRLKFTARPIKPTWVQRECLKRIYRIFHEKGIQFASGAVTVQTMGLPDAASPALLGAGAATAAVPPPRPIAADAAE
jgi:moderate conductance mechanosensitive channel